MPTLSNGELTAALRRHFFPVLEAQGFQQVKPRNAYRHEPDAVCIVSYTSLGAYLSKQTGFPSLSLTALVGMHWPCVPNPFSAAVSHDKDGSPEGMVVHASLLGEVRQQPRKNLSKVEQARRDIWWIEPDGSNLDAVCMDLAGSFAQQGVPWFEGWRTLERALATTLAEEKDYPARTWRLFAFAKALGRADLLAALRPKLEAQWPKHFRILTDDRT